MREEKQRALQLKKRKTMNLTKKEFPKAIKINEENEYKLIYDTIIYGIRKFTKLIGINKVVIGVSGGIDSALSSAVYVNAIGKDNVLLYNAYSLSGNADGIHDLGRFIIHDDHIRSLNGCVRTNTAHGNAYIRAGQNRSIIDAVTHKSQGLSL